ncbi:putative zinc-containing alcohol dehydrogenase [Umbelopsis sp. PMI_123]|nr:putative zinc-containing alcohol dehydrogenase [Umbelopsis sp. PMI_123]
MPRTVKAGVITEFNTPPKFQDIEIPDPSEHQTQIKVLATGLHQLVKGRASGAHYSSNVKLPLIPGVDGVGVLPNGELKYFMSFNPTSTGTFAEYANVANEDLLPVPKGADPAVIAALVNPTMSSWLALRNRVELKKGFTVLILGVTGVSGQLAVQISRLLGASRIVGAGRNQKALDNLLANGMDAAITLSDDNDVNVKSFAREAADVDIVLDYLYGPIAEVAMNAILGSRTDVAHRLDWIQIGSMAGTSISLPANTIRSADLRILGSGLGSNSWADMRRELVELIKELAAGRLTGAIDPKKLEDVTTVWSSKSDGRHVFVL